jgi:hypothetical protein
LIFMRIFCMIADKTAGEEEVYDGS